MLKRNQTVVKERDELMPLLSVVIIARGQRLMRNWTVLERSTRTNNLQTLEKINGKVYLFCPASLHTLYTQHKSQERFLLLASSLYTSPNNVILSSCTLLLTPPSSPSVLMPGKERITLSRKITLTNMNTFQVKIMYTGMHVQKNTLE